MAVAIDLGIEKLEMVSIHSYLGDGRFAFWSLNLTFSGFNPRPSGRWPIEWTSLNEAELEFQFTAIWEMAGHNWQLNH